MDKWETVMKASRGISIRKYEFTEPTLKLRRFKADDMERYDDEGIVEIPKGTENSNEGAEGSIGPDAHGHEDKSEAKCEIAALKYEIQRLDRAMSSMESIMSTLIQKLGHIESSLPKMKDDILKDIVVEVLKVLTSKGSDSFAPVKKKCLTCLTRTKGRLGHVILPSRATTFP